MKYFKFLTSKKVLVNLYLKRIFFKSHKMFAITYYKKYQLTFHNHRNQAKRPDCWYHQQVDTGSSRDTVPHQGTYISVHLDWNVILVHKAKCAVLHGSKWCTTRSHVDVRTIQLIMDYMMEIELLQMPNSPEISQIFSLYFSLSYFLNEMVAQDWTFVLNFHCL